MNGHLSRVMLIVGVELNLSEDDSLVMLGASARGMVRLRMGLADWQLLLGGVRSRGMSWARVKGGAKHYRRMATAQQILHYLYMACMVH